MLQVFVSPGDKVKKGDLLFTVEGMKIVVSPIILSKTLLL